MTRSRSSAILKLAALVVCVACCRKPAADEEVSPPAVTAVEEEAPPAPEEKEEVVDYAKGLLGKWEYEATEVDIGGVTTRSKVFHDWTMTFNEDGTYGELTRLQETDPPTETTPGATYTLEGKVIKRQENAVELTIDELTEDRLVVISMETAKISFKRIE